jgi:hypothetical protein
LLAAAQAVDKSPLIMAVVVVVLAVTGHQRAHLVGVHLRNPVYYYFPQQATRLQWARAVQA